MLTFWRWCLCIFLRPHSKTASENNIQRCLRKNMNSFYHSSYSIEPGIHRTSWKNTQPLYLYQRIPWLFYSVSMPTLLPILRDHRNGVSQWLLTLLRKVSRACVYSSWIHFLSACDDTLYFTGFCRTFSDKYIKQALAAEKEIFETFSEL